MFPMDPLRNITFLALNIDRNVGGPRSLNYLPVVLNLDLLSLTYSVVSLFNVTQTHKQAQPQKTQIHKHNLNLSLSLNMDHLSSNLITSTSCSHCIVYFLSYISQMLLKRSIQPSKHQRIQCELRIFKLTYEFRPYQGFLYFCV